MKWKSLAPAFFLSCVFQFGCAHREATQGLELMSEADFEKTIEISTQRTQQYQGLYNTLDVSGTLRNSAVLKAQNDQSARLYQWDRAKFQAELNKTSEKSKTETEVFLSFYTPDRKNDDLNKTATQWRTYLEVDGRRWEGKVSKVRLQISEIQGLYPYHTRFATPYTVSFPVSTASVDGKAARVTVTGPVGIATLNFNPQNSPESTGSNPTP